MNAAHPLLRWQSSADPAVTALEWLQGEPSAARLKAALDSVPARDGCPAFVLVGARADGAAAAATLGGALPPSTRLVLAVGRNALEAVADTLDDASGVGLLLDDVDLDTPMHALVHPRIEAIRFRAGFVLEAEQDLRIGCALAALLGLAREVGFATLGPARAPNDDWLAPEIGFDLVPSYRIGADTDGTRRVAAGERTASEFQLSR